QDGRNLEPWMAQALAPPWHKGGPLVHILEGRLGVRSRHAVRFPLRHILCNRLTCSLMCSCRNPSAVTFLYMCQTISFSKSSRDAPAALASIIAFFARSSSVGCEAKMRSWSPKHAGTRSRQSIFQASILAASLSPNPLRLRRLTAGAAGFLLLTQCRERPER